MSADATSGSTYEGPASYEWLEAELQKVDNSSVYSETEKKKMTKLLKARHFKANAEAAGLERPAAKKQRAKAATKAGSKAAADDSDEEAESDEAGPRLNYYRLCTVVCATGNNYAFAKQQLKVSKEGSEEGARHYGIDLADGVRPGGQAPNGGKAGTFWQFDRCGAVQPDAAVPILVYLKKETPGCLEKNGCFSLCTPPGQQYFTEENLKPNKWDDSEVYRQETDADHPHGVFKFINAPGDASAPGDGKAKVAAAAAGSKQKKDQLTEPAAVAAAAAPPKELTEEEMKEQAKSWQVRRCT